MTEILGFAKPHPRGLGFPNATEDPFYIIKRLVAPKCERCGGSVRAGG